MLILVLAAALAAEPAATPGATPAATAKPAAAQDDPVVCRNEPVAGSHLPRKVCVRRSDADAHRRAAQDAVQNIQRGVRGPRSN